MFRLKGLSGGVGGSQAMTQIALVDCVSSTTDVAQSSLRAVG